MAIYVDVLFVINFIINFLLLRVTALLLGQAPHTGRLCLGALAGALGALVIFLPRPAGWQMFLFRFLLAACMTAAAFRWRGAKRFATQLFCLFTASLLFSGLLLAWQFATRPQGVLVSNGAVYFHIGATTLLGCGVGGYLLSLLLGQLLRRRSPPGHRCEVTLLHNGAVAVFPALLDTGSSLVEPFSRCPVMVCEQQALGRALPPALYGFCWNEETSAIPKGLRAVCYRTLDAGGVLPAFRPEGLLAKLGDTTYPMPDCYVAVLDRPLDAGDCRAICNPDAIQTNCQKVGVSKL